MTNIHISDQFNNAYNNIARLILSDMAASSVGYINLKCIIEFYNSRYIESIGWRL